MSAMEEIQNPMAAAAIITSLSNSFRLLPLSAIPPMLDCILASTSLSPSSLFYSLLDDLANLIEVLMRTGSWIPIIVRILRQWWEHYAIFSLKERVLFPCFLDALQFVHGVHCIDKGGFYAETNHEGLQSFLWKGFIPLMKTGHEFDRELLNQIADSFFDVVQKTNAWEVLEATLVPFFLRSVGISAGIIQNEELDGAKWYRSSVFQVSNDLIEIVAKNKDYMLSPNRSFSVPLSCHILSIILDAALRAAQASPAADSVLANGSIMLKIIFKAFVSHSSFSITVNGETHILSRNHFFKRIWICCRRLFSLGSLERRDAYSILSLYLSYFSCTTTYENTDMSDGAEEFDIRSEKELWNEIKRGLVDEEGLVRKQSLHILKTVLCMSSANQCHSGISEKKSEGKHSGPHGVTKRDRWAYNKAKSLGVVKLCNSVDSGLNSRQQWEAFLLLFEMLEEYGTHLVEAAWNHQVLDKIFSCGMITLFFT
ncbi:hypothetical protein COLO4_22133 [Corchorus olitorius]|uniref:Uncharacterized protein n=1 Tax=Corchorus olitorius TaxID=93759 RepID=A0A1R3INX3_9ROSI|nr:hypothetical protein COLO4_22133 [Corchorus olitorius]